MSLLHPLYLLLVPLYLLLVWLLNRHFKRVEFSNYKLLTNTIKSSYDFSKILKFLIALLMVVALADPATKQLHSAKDTKGYDISLLLDASYSMREDNRFQKAKEILANFLKKRKNDNIALTLFANSAFVASPLSYDKKSIIKMLQYINLGIAGGRSTALYEALFLGADIFEKSQKGNRVMILLTDGINTVKSISLESAIAKIKNQNIKVYTIALGKKGDYNREVLNKIASDTGGKFYTAVKPDELELIYAQIDSLESAKIKSKSFTTYKHYFEYPLLGAFLLILLYGWIYHGSYNKTLMIMTVILLLTAIYQPGRVTFKTATQSAGEFTIAIDLSNYTRAKDIYPNRLAFSKAKILQLLNTLSGQKVALLAFAKEAYLVSPPTRDYERLKYLVKNIDPSNIKRDSANFKSLLAAVDKTANSQIKEVLIFSSGGVGSLREAKDYAIKHNIRVYTYTTATEKGGIIKIDGKIVKDKSGNIVITRANAAFRELATLSGGEHYNYSLSNDSNFVNTLGSKTRERLSDKKQKEELYYIPLLIALFTYILGVVRPKRALNPKGRL